MGKKYDDAMKRLEAIAKAIPGQIEAMKAEVDCGSSAAVVIEHSAMTAYGTLMNTIEQAGKGTPVEDAARRVIDGAIAGSAIGGLVAIASVKGASDGGCKCGGCEDASERG